MMLKIFIACGGVLCGLLLAEVYVRWYIPLPAACVVTDEVLNHVWRPNYTCHSRNLVGGDGRPFSIRYNSQSWREDHEVSAAKPAGTYRIFFVGDSFTAGTCPIEKAMPSVVERELHAQYAASPWKIEVVNTGTSSWSPVIYYVLLKTRVLHYAPDLVLISVDMTDTFDDFIYSRAARRGPQGEIEAIPSDTSFSQCFTRAAGGLRVRSAWEILLQRLSRLSHIAEFAHESLSARLYAHAPADPALPTLYEWCLQEWPAGAAERVAQSMDQLRAVIKLAQQHGVKVAVTAVPHLDQMLGPPARFSSLQPMIEVRKVAADLAVPYFDSYAALRPVAEREGAAALFIPNDMHFNERGYAVWAQGYVQFLREHAAELLPGQLP